jgi:hypothetical protein
VRYLGKVFTDADRVQQQWIGVLIWVFIAVAIVAFHGARSFMKSAEGQAKLAVQV